MQFRQKISGVKTRHQIAHEYNFSYPTFWRKLKELQIDLPKGLITPKWQKRIYDQLGHPSGVAPGDFER